MLTYRIAYPTDISLNPNIENIDVHIVFRDDSENLNIDCVTLNNSGKIVHHEQFSRPGIKTDYKLCRGWICDCRLIDPKVGERIFADWERRNLISEEQGDFYDMEAVRKWRPINGVR